MFTLFGFFVTLLFLAGVGFNTWLHGGQAYSPGELSARSIPGVELQGFASHADFEPDCSRCHQPLKTRQDALCLECHENVADQIAEKNGTHAHLEMVSPCFDCHSDHQGRDFNPTEAAFKTFDHSLTHFSLVWHQVTYNTVPMACTDCHNLEGQFKTDMDNCALCHANQDIDFMVLHVTDFSNDCIDCHDGEDRMINFDHSQTEFPLDGRHQLIRCGQCHGQEATINRLIRGSASRSQGLQLIRLQNAPPQPGDELFKSTPVECSGCHAESPVHHGMFEGTCKTCHSTSGWTPAILEGEPFDHETHTGFSLMRHGLDFEGDVIHCNDCHQGSLVSFDVNSCINCHTTEENGAAFMFEHQAQYGQTCQGCHDGRDRMSDFKHDSVFPLQDRHAEIECQACHIDQVYTGTPQECVSCHAEPELHAGFFGLSCQNCHTARAWAPAHLKAHNFPLDHGEGGESECQVCHNESYTRYTCYGCHDHQEAAITAGHIEAGITLEELPDCAACHPDGVVVEEQTKLPFPGT